MPGGVLAAKPGYEVKCILRPTMALDLDGRPIRAVQEALYFEGKVRSIWMQFLDGGQGELHRGARWNVRIRKREGKNDAELTFKKRYGAELDGIDATLAKAAGEGFDRDSEGSTWDECQVEWGHNKRTLTFSLERARNVPDAQYTVLPGVEVSRAWALAELPAALERALPGGRAREILGGAQVYGPVEGTR